MNSLKSLLFFWCVCVMPCTCRVRAGYFSAISHARYGCHLHFIDIYKERTHVLFKDFHPIWPSHVQ